MELDIPRDNDASSSKRKAYEVDFDALSQDAVENLIRKDVEHISSIFGIPVSLMTLYPLNIVSTCLLTALGPHCRMTRPPSSMPQHFHRVHLVFLSEQLAVFFLISGKPCILK